MENDFVREYESARRERLKLEREREYDINYVGDRCYALFRVWCNGYKAVIKAGTKGEIDYEEMKKTSYVNDRYFREFCKEQKTFNARFSDRVIKKYIAEKYLGLEYYLDECGNERVRRRDLQPDADMQK